LSSIYDVSVVTDDTHHHHHGNLAEPSILIMPVFEVRELLSHSHAQEITGKLAKSSSQPEPREVVKWKRKLYFFASLREREKH
jgi:hypothetical protein